MKRGISLVSLVIVIIIMVILSGIIIFSGVSTVNDVNINIFATEILNIQNAVDEYYYRNGKYPTATSYVLETTTIDNGSLEQFAEESITDNKIEFKTVDLSVLGINKTGFGNTSRADVYVLSEVTGKVYYMAGVTYEDKTYYTLADELYTIIGADRSEGLVDINDVKVYDVIFSPSAVSYTNVPVTVDIKLPKEATINSITTTNTRSISQEIIRGMYKVVSVNKTSTNKAGNYTIEVNYTYEGVEKQAAYKVDVFDADKPTLNTSTAVKDGMKTISVNTTDEMSGIKFIKYVESEIEDVTYFREYGKELTGQQIVLREDGAYTIYVEDNAGNYNHKVVIGESEVPATWRKNVVTIYNGVPIPNGFVYSQVDGENRKSGGLVIYEGREAVTDNNVETARRTRNQFVWVPIKNFTEFVRVSYSSNVISNTLGTNTWEIRVSSSNMPMATQSTSYVTNSTQKTGITNTKAEANAMYKSVAEYGGFYVARYEAGIDEDYRGSTAIITGTQIYSVMGKYPYKYISWGTSMANDTGGAVHAARSMYPVTIKSREYGVVSTLMYAVQWDSIMEWWKRDKAVEYLTSSNSYGNCSDTTIESTGFNEGAQYAEYITSLVSFQEIPAGASKASGDKWLLTTGAMKKAKVKNIYDMSGNVREWTMEGEGTDKRIRRGGSYNASCSGGSSTPVVYRGAPAPSEKASAVGFRVALYIRQD